MPDFGIIEGALLGGALEGGAEAAVGAGIAEGAGGAAALGDAVAGAGAAAGAEGTFIGGGAELLGGAEVGSESALAAGFSGAGEFAGAGELASFSPETFNALGLESFGGETAGLFGGGTEFASSAEFSGFGADFGSDLSGLGDTQNVGFTEGQNLEPTTPWSGEETSNYLDQFGRPVGDQPTTPNQDVVDQTVSQDPAERAAGTGGSRAGAAGGAEGAAGAGKGGLGNFNPGSLLNSLMQMAKGPSKPASLGAASAVAAALQSQAQMLIDQYNRGELSGAMMSKIRMDLQGTLNKVRQFYKSAGRYNSTDRIQAENLATQQASAAMAASLAQELQQGLQALGQAGGLYGQIAAQEIAADTAYQNSLSRSLGNIMRLPLGGGGGSFIPSAGETSDSSGGGGGESESGPISEAA